jgi:hypothetical protein
LLAHFSSEQEKTSERQRGFEREPIPLCLFFLVQLAAEGTFCREFSATSQCSRETGKRQVERSLWEKWSGDGESK